MTGIMCPTCGGLGGTARERAALGPIRDPYTRELLVAAGTVGTLQEFDRCRTCKGEGTIPSRSEESLKDSNG